MNSITGNHVIFIEETSSTNEALKLEEQFNKIPEGTLLYTHFQSQGKGQANAKWESAPSQNLLLSVLYNPHFLKIEEQMYLNFAIALACRQFLATFLPDKKVWIKWPNDLVVSGHKIGGILIENSIAGNKLKNSVVGIGLNVNQLNFENAFAISLAQLSGTKFELPMLRKALCQCLDHFYSMLQMRKFEPLKSLYESHLLQKGESAEFIIKGIKQTGQILGIGNHGKLHVMIDGEILSFLNKELVYCSLNSSNE
jgi:BirA family biotin operon repressor/biotin-[acetyl-CoA-carboxylase] ligase